MAISNRLHKNNQAVSANVCRVTQLHSLLLMRIVQHEIHEDLGTLLRGAFVGAGDHDLSNGVLRSLVQPGSCEAK